MGLSARAPVLTLADHQTAGRKAPHRPAALPAVPPAPPGSFLAKEEAQGGDCELIVPADPLSARGLATPYQLANGPNTACSMDAAGVAATGAFVQATILEPGGHLFVYDPLVVTAGTTPAIAPPVPDIPDGSVVTIDTGFNGNIDFLAGPGAYLFDQGIPGSPFGQVAFANGPLFYFLAQAEHVAVPPLGTAKDGTTCPTTRAFSLVDQDQSDNVTSQYLVTPGGQTALDTPANLAALPGPRSRTTEATTSSSPCSRTRRSAAPRSRRPACLIRAP